MRRLEIWAFVLFAFSGGLVGTTCQQTGGPSNSPSAESSDPSNESDSDRGRSCRVDRQCDSYLRCIEGACRIPPAVTGEHDDETPRIHFYEQAGGGSSDTGESDDVIASFWIELATTRSERSRGLMYRRNMADGWGMLFVYPGSAERSFWMKNTLIPLDMVFIGPDGRIVHVVESAEPMTRTPRPSKHPARYVLELQGGSAARHGLDVGQYMRLEGVSDRFRPD